MNNKLGSIILAAGKGKRMNLKGVNKVTIYIGSKPIIVQNIEILKNLRIDSIVVVIGYAKESIQKLLRKEVLYAKQNKQLGTANAVESGIAKLSKEIEHVIILNGDTLYSSKFIQTLINTYFENDCTFMFATVYLDNPTGIGRVVRKNGNIEAVIEEKDATGSSHKIKEVNAGCYIGKVDFFKKYLPKVKKSNYSGEYYLTDIIGLAAKNHERIETIEWKGAWTGINTLQDLDRVQEKK